LYTKPSPVAEPHKTSQLRNKTIMLYLRLCQLLASQTVDYQAPSESTNKLNNK